MISKAVQVTSGRHAVVLAAIFLFVFSCAIYAGALRHGFVWDDEGVITNAPEIRDFANLPSFFTKPLVLGESDAPGTATDVRIRYYRPLTTTLHAVEYRLFGENPLGYKVVNLLLNGAVVVCAFLLVQAITGATSLAFLATLLYAATPARGEVVYWIYSDSHLLAGLFALLTVLAYHRGRTAAALGLMTVGLFFQEGTILVAGALLTYQLTIPAERGKGWRRLVPFMALAAGYLLLRRLVAGSVAIADLDWLDRLRAAAYLLVKYLQITFVTDAPVTMYRYEPGMFAGGGAATPAILLAAVLLLLLGGWLWWRRRPWCFWYAWFVVWIALAFNVGSYAGYLMAEKSLYLAALGPCVLLTALLTRPDRTRYAGWALLLVLVGYQTWGTVQRGRYWTDTVTYIEKLLEFEPRYDVAQYQLGVEYLKQGRYAEAVSQFDKLLALRPNQRQRVITLKTDTYDRWGQALAERGDLDGALTALNQARQLSPQRSRTYNGLGIIHYLRGELAEARNHWETAVQLDPDNLEAKENLRRLGQ
jgi:hypothetical protein